MSVIFVSVFCACLQGIDRCENVDVCVFTLRAYEGGRMCV